jgi:cytidylate kinase
MHGLLRVLVTASPETRTRRLSGLGALLTEGDAVTAVRESDGERRDYLRRFYQVSEELPTHYDVVINTDVLRPAEAVNLIVAAARDTAPAAGAAPQALP